MNKIYADVTEDNLVDLPNFQWVVLASEAEEREAALQEELDTLRESYELMRDRKNSIVFLQQRLTDAEKLLQRVHQADALSHCCPLWKAIDAALKSTSEDKK